MTFSEIFLIPLGVSLFANYAPSKITQLINKLNGNNEPLKKLFTKSIINTIESNKSNFIVEHTNNIISKLIYELKDDDTKLFIAINTICENKNKNFLNILKDKENNDFTKELFHIYAIDISNVKEDSFYDLVIKNLLINYKQIFLQNLKTETALSLIFKEVLKIDNLVELIEDMKSKIEQSNINNNSICIKDNDGTTFNKVFKSIEFEHLEKDYSSALTCIGLGERQVSSCPSNNQYIDEITIKLNLTKMCIIKGASGSGKSLLTYQVAKKYHDNGWNIYRLNKTIFKENIKIDNQFKKSLIIVDDAQTLTLLKFETLAGYVNDECIILFNWNSSTPVNSNFLSNYPCINIAPVKQVEMLKSFSLNNLNSIHRVLKTLNISLGKYDHYNNIIARIERASQEETPWLFNYTLTEGWRTANNDMELLKNKKRLDLVMAIVAIFQYVTLDNGVNIQVILDEAKKYSNNTQWLNAAKKTIEDYCIQIDDIVKHKHYNYASKVLHTFIDNNKDENINSYVIDLFKRILIDKNFEAGYSNVLEFIMFDYRYINFYLNKEKFPESMTKDLFLKSQSTNDVKIKNINSLIRFDKSVLSIVELHIDTIYKWIIEVNRNTAYPLSNLINTLYNEKQSLNITENIMEVVFNRIVEVPLIEKSRYSSLYNRLHMFSTVKQIRNSDKLIMDISEISFGIAHYHFAKVISDLSYIDVKWANNCIKMNLESIAKNFNEDLMESYSLYSEILQSTFGLIPMMLGIKTNKNPHNFTAKKLAKLINIESVLNSFKSLKLSDTQNFSSLLFFFRVYNKNKLDEISNKIDYEYLKVLYKNDFLQEHNHKTIVYGLYNPKSEAFKEYISYLIDNCKYLDDNLLMVNPKKALEKLKKIKKYKMHFHGSDGYEMVVSIYTTLDEEDEHDLSLKIIRDNHKTIKECILNNISNADNNKEKYDFLLYLYQNTPELLEKIFNHLVEVNKLIEKIYKLLRGKVLEKEIAKLYILFIKEFTTSHNEEIEKLEKRFSSIKRFKI